jgi:lipopolysaccharide transport system permease protein
MIVLVTGGQVRLGLYFPKAPFIRILRLRRRPSRHFQTPQDSRLMQHFSISPQAMTKSLWHNRSLVRALVQRDVMGRYRGSFMGILWSLFNPVFMLSVYTFMFSVVFKARWSGGGESRTEFALVLFAGLIVFNIFGESINRAPSCILNNTNYVKKVLFPLEILPCVALGSALFHALVSIGVWVLAYALLFGVPHATALFLPLILLPMLLFTLGLSWALAALGVYLRDVSQVVGLITTALMFLSPIFYPVSALPEDYRTLMLLNPLTPSIEQVRAVLFWGNLPDFGLLGLSLVGAALTAWLGFAWFQKTRKGFADVL